MSTLINPHHERFAQLLADAIIGVSNDTKEEAYSKTFPDRHVDDPKALQKAAYNLAKTKQIEGRVEELINTAQSRRTLSRMRVRELRCEIAENPESENRDRLAAMRDEAKMMGWDEPEKVEAAVTVFIRTDFDETE